MLNLDLSKIQDFHTRHILRQIVESLRSVEVSGVPGPRGAQGATGPVGPQGEQGDTGPAGPTGPQGPQGDIGPTGLTGPQGPAGADGAPGTPGVDGIDGIDGIDGADGTILHPSLGIELIDNFVATTASGNLGWTILTNSGAVGTTASIGDGSTMGLVRLETSTSATSAPTITLGSGATIVLGVNSLSIEFRMKVGALSTGAEEFIFRGGLSSSTTSAAPTNCVIFEYDRATSGNFWRIRCKTGASDTATVTASAVNTNWNSFKININATGTSAEFFINGVSVGTISTNIPTTTSSLTSPCFQMIKTVGTTTRLSYIDWFYLRMVYGL
jgi:hypothetical protein